MKISTGVITIGEYPHELRIERSDDFVLATGLIASFCFNVNGDYKPVCIRLLRRKDTEYADEYALHISPFYTLEDTPEKWQDAEVLVCLENKAFKEARAKFEIEREQWQSAHE